MLRSFRRLIESQIKKAEAEGQLSGLEGEGKPLPYRPGDTLIDPADAVGYRIMAEAGAMPEEIKLKAQLDEAKAAYQETADPDEKKRLMAEIADLDMKHSMAREARKKFLGN